MIITCEECTTRFKLDDARIPDKGAKVRCSKCKHAFFVKPEAIAGDPVENAVSQALVDDDAQAEDLTRPDDSGESLRGPDDQSAQSAMDDFEESDWEFNTEEPASSGEELEGFQESPGLALEDAGGDTPALGDTSGFDLGGDVGELTEPDVDLETQPTAPLDTAMETVDGLLGGAGDDEDEELFDTSPGAVESGIGALLDDSEEESGASELGEAPGAGSEIGGLLDDDDDNDDASELEIADEPGHDLRAAPEIESAPVVHDPVDAALDDLGLGGQPAPAPEAAAAADGPAPEVAAPAREELGDPGDWDFFAEEGDASADRKSATTQPMAIGRMGAVSPEAQPHPPVQVDPEPAAPRVWERRAANAVGWALVCALSALILRQAFWVTPRIVPPARSSQELAGLEASAIEGRWVENVDGSMLYVVSGELTSTAGVHKPGARLAIRLLDASGTLLVDEAADLGRPLSAAALREESPEVLRASQADTALALSSQPIFPARPRRFAAVLQGVPHEARRFELVAVPVEPRRRSSPKSARTSR